MAGVAWSVKVPVRMGWFELGTATVAEVLPFDESERGGRKAKQGAYRHLVHVI
jgi:hypothetical protein